MTLILCVGLLSLAVVSFSGCASEPKESDTPADVVKDESATAADATAAQRNRGEIERPNKGADAEGE